MRLPTFSKVMLVIGRILLTLGTCEFARLDRLIFVSVFCCHLGHIRELKHRRRNGRTTTAGSEIFARECSAQARTSLNVVQGSSTTKFLWVWRSRENVSAKQCFLLINHFCSHFK